MKWHLVLTDAAERDIDAAAIWYENESTGVGKQFLDAVGAALSRVEEDPHNFPVVHRDKRRALLKRFPYALYFRLDSPKVVVVGCFHGRRSPKAWKSRR